MSLYGTGRSEGVAAALLIGALVLAVRTTGGLVDGHALLASLQPALLPALGGLLCYRFLRAQGRSRFTGFLVGAAYGLSPWLLSIEAMPREQIAAALAPLALEAVCRCDRPSWRERWLPWAWICFAAPFVAGFTMVGLCCSLLVVTGLLRTITCGDRDDERPPVRGLLLIVVAGTAAAANFVWLDLLSPWLHADHSVAPAIALAAHRSSEPGLDLAAMLRVPGPVLVMLALLGALRRQRHVDASVWWSIVAAGALPTVVTLVPSLAAALPDFLTAPFVLTAAWWLVLLATAVLGAAGLDDFLDLPLRRRTALPWLLAVAVLAAPLLSVLGAHHPAGEWPLVATFLGLALVLPTWRKLGILTFKNALAAFVLMALTLPALQVPPTNSVPPAMPAGEFGPRRPAGFDGDRPTWHYSGFSVAALIGAMLLLSAMRRRQRLRPTPTPAKAAIKKKAKPSQRS